jgi:hypothetical protein
MMERQRLPLHGNLCAHIDIDHHLLGPYPLPEQFVSYALQGVEGENGVPGKLFQPDDED